MKIIFIRHGKPDFNPSQWLGSDKVHSRLLGYKESRVTTPPSSDQINLAEKSAYYCMTSELSRAQDSATLLFNTAPEVSALFNEAELPHPNRLWLPLPWSAFLVIYRLAWLLGYRKNAAGRQQDLHRANAAANLLLERASEHACVYVLGHGIMNRLIVRALVKQGMSVQSKNGDGYWAQTEVCLSSVIPS